MPPQASGAKAQLDAVTLEILLNALRSVADETYLSLMRSAYSTNIKERNDHSTALIDPKGRLIALCEAAQPIHLSSMLGLTTRLLERYRLSDFKPGDIFVGNDPFAAGGSHLPDVNMSMPVFAGEDLLGFMCNIAHHADIGGMSPGSMSGGTEIYQEGLRIPPVRLFDGGRLCRDMFDLILLNVRVPAERRGDYNAQIAACRLGARRIEELAATRGTATLLRAYDEIVERTFTRMTREARKIPPGAYRFIDVMDDDGKGALDMPIAITVTSGDPTDEGRIRFDFTGTSPAVKGNINCPYYATQSSVAYVFRAMIDPECPINQGMLDAMDVVAPEGCLVNAAFPSAVAGRANTCQRIIDTVIGALADALPGEAVGAANGANTMAVFSGRGADGKRYVYLETVGGGFGGRAAKDGKDGVQVHLINTSNLPVEAIETEYPLLVEAYELIPDSGGAGEHRGGLGLRRVLRPRGHVAQFSGQGERFRNAPWGVFGGGRGGTGRFLIRRADGREEELPTKPSFVEIGPDEALIVETAGAGGYGDPASRSPEALARDLASGKFSAGYLARHYPQFAQENAQ
ncbi:hydantoinase B/oxoprolinase family protein [Novosphingobium naphthalenivorans]|uniref:hydantoinase B/oxoprolinase family protein n=1 Tax=Novosphingobium naphthalenivorans TaxID=273168 RepID=UPI001C3F1603|nr:hydantoinase B/oxoprolinase family protein [Novosphingobium naphthalenivorans]